jgi:hypothetical protein
MNTPSRKETLFLAASQLAGPERDAFLDRECASDTSLRARLEELLIAQDATDGVLAKQPDPSRSTIALERRHLPDSAVGQPIGRYRLLEKLAAVIAETISPCHGTSRCSYFDMVDDFELIRVVGQACMVSIHPKLVRSRRQRCNHQPVPVSNHRKVTIRRKTAESSG